MSIPKYKEGGHARAARLNLGKPHIMWCRHLGIWLLAVSTLGKPFRLAAWDRCDYMNARWTPRSKQ